MQAIWSEITKYLPGQVKDQLPEVIDDTRQKFNDLNTWLISRQQSAVTEASFTSNPQKLVHALLACLTTLEVNSPKKFIARITAFRLRVQELIPSLLQLANCDTQGATSQAGPIVAELTRLSLDAEQLFLDIFRHFRWRKLALRLSAWLPLALTAASLLWLTFRGGMELTSAVVFFPYSSATDQPSPNTVLRLSEENLDEFMEQFSLFYFNRPNKFAAMIFEQESPSAPLLVSIVEDTNFPAGSRFRPDPICRLKLDLLELSQLREHVISTVGVDAKLTRAGVFPWHRLQTNPQLELETNHYGPSGSMFIKNWGIGPACDVNCTLVTESGLELSVAQFDAILHFAEWEYQGLKGATDICACPVLVPPPRHEIVEFDEDREEHLPSTLSGLSRDSSQIQTAIPVFFRLEGKPIEVNENIHFEHNEQWFEIITTFPRLSQVTTVSWREPLHVKIDYHCLKGVRRLTQKLIEPIPDRVFFVRREGLGIRDPRSPPEMTGGSAPAAAPSMYGFLDRLAPLFFTGDSDHKGVDHIKVDSEIDVRLLDERGHATQINHIDKTLNPRGTTGIYLKLKGIQTGIYEVTVTVDGHMVGGIGIETLVPDRLRFQRDPKWENFSAHIAEDTKAEIDRLKKYFTAWYGEQ